MKLKLAVCILFVIAVVLACFAQNVDIAGNAYQRVQVQNYAATNTVNFTQTGIIQITNVTAGVTLVCTNRDAGRGVTLFFTSATSNIVLSLPWTWVGYPLVNVISNRQVVISAFGLGTATNDVIVSAVTSQ